MRRVSHPQLFVLARDLSDAERTILEAIDATGSVTVRDAGRIVCRIGGYRTVLRRERLFSAGNRVLRQLERGGLVCRTRGGWVRAGKAVV